MKDGDEVTVVISRTTVFLPASIVPDEYRAECVHGAVDNAWWLRESAQLTTMRRAIPAGCFFVRGWSMMCFVRETDEDTVWVRGHVKDGSEIAMSLLAAWHTGKERIIGLFADGEPAAAAPTP